MLLSFIFRFPFNLTEVVRFEPTNTGVKFLCLTTWRYPNVVFFITFTECFEKYKVKYL